MVDPVPDLGRRRFLNWFLGTAAGAFLVSVLYPVLRFVSPPEVPEAAVAEMEAGSTDDPELAEKGFKIIRFGAEPVIVLRVSDNEYRAFTATCTHLDCVVEYRRDRHLIWCNCHNGQYDLTGQNVAGPPPRPLTAYKVHLVAKGSGRPPTLVVGKA
ncbi:MAG: ubiquinol-cytochrome c reductase iron-sulfur subunit [Thermoanaerobaculia bacterium]